MTHDISHRYNPVWAARTLVGMVLVDRGRHGDDRLSGADLVTLRRTDGEVAVARMIGPVAGGVPEEEGWRIDAILAVDPQGVPLSSMLDPGGAPAGPHDGMHDWGALGLPAGLDTGVRPVGAPAELDELALARGSSGHRHGEESILLKLSPGESVWVGDASGIVLAVDRRKRTVEIDAGGEVCLAAFDDVKMQETS